MPHVDPIDATRRLYVVFHKPFLFTRAAEKQRERRALPLLFVLMSGRKTHDYKDVLCAVIALLPSEPRVKRVVIDFERAMWKCFVSVMPEVELKGCAFHWSQAVWRKVQEYGLQQQCMKDRGTLMYIKRLITLPFLPAQHIPAVFNNLVQDAGSEPLCRLVEYVSSIRPSGPLQHEACSPSISVPTTMLRGGTDV